MPLTDQGREHSPLLTAGLTALDHARGPELAPMTLLEYGDYECPFCRSAHPMIQELRRALGSRLRFAYRHFPLSEMHPYALLAAKAAEAAALQGRFWEMHDAMLETLAPLSAATLLSLAETLSLDMLEFTAALEDQAILDKIKEDRRGGVRSGVNGTPTFFVNGVRYNGLPRYEELAAFLTSPRR